MYRGSTFRGRGKYRKSGYYGRYKKRFSPGGGVQVERKFLDSLSSALGVDDTTTGSPLLENALTVEIGSGENKRNGRKIVITAVGIRGYIRWLIEGDGNTATVNTATDINKVRVLIVIDKQCNGVVADVSDLLDNLVITDPLYAFNNLANKGRFITLYDKIHNFNRQIVKLATGDFTHVVKEFKFYKKCRIPVLYSGSNGTIGERCCNNITMRCWAQEKDTATPLVNKLDVVLNTRIRFMDI